VPGIEDTAASPDAAAFRSKLRLVDDLADALLGQVRRVVRQGEAARGLPRGTKKALRELADEAAAIERSRAALRAAVGDSEPAAGAQASSPAADRQAARQELVRAVAIDLRHQGHTREEVRERLEQTFGADEAAEVVDHVFDV
jgi:hypothetical protein